MRIEKTNRKKKLIKVLIILLFFLQFLEDTQPELVLRPIYFNASHTFGAESG